MAAARKVSAAASITLAFPFSGDARASPMEVVFAGAVDADDDRTEEKRSAAVPVGGRGRECENFRDLIFQLAFQVFGFGRAHARSLAGGGRRGLLWWCERRCRAEQRGLELAQRGADGAIAGEDLLTLSKLCLRCCGRNLSRRSRSGGSRVVRRV